MGGRGAAIFFFWSRQGGEGGGGCQKIMYDVGGGCPLSFTSLPVNSSCTKTPPPPPAGDCGAFTRLVSPGGETVANFALPGDRAFANHGATPELLTCTQFPIIQIHYTDTDEVPGFFQ